MKITNTEIDNIAEVIYSHADQRESFLGGHFISEYTDCPWKFFFKYVLGWSNIQNQVYFTRGQALHIAIESYLTKALTYNEALYFPRYYIMDKSIFNSPQESDQELDLVTAMMKAWLENYGESDPENYIEVEHEIEHTIHLSNGFPITVRMDRVVEEKSTKNLLIFDTKTTSQTMERMLQSFRLGTQGQTYMYAFKEIFKKEPAGIILDVIRGRTLMAGPTVEVYRPPLITYDRYKLIQWEMNMIGILSEMTQKVKTYYENPDMAEFLFYRNPGKCAVFGCPYSDLCLRNVVEYTINNPHNPPVGFINDPWVEEHNLKDVLIQPEYLSKLFYDLSVQKTIV